MQAMLEQILDSLPPSCRITDCPLLLRTLAEVTTEIEHERAIPFEVPLYRVSLRALTCCLSSCLMIKATLQVLERRLPGPKTHLCVVWLRAFVQK